MIADRLRSGLSDIMDSRVPGLFYLASYPGKVVQQRGPDSFDFEPDDSRLPSLAGIPIKLPHPGVNFQIDAGAGTRAELRFAGGDPRAPELHLWDAQGLQSHTLMAAQSVTLSAPAIKLGSSSASHPLVWGDSLSAATSSLTSAWSQFQSSTTQLASALTSYAQGIQPNADPGPAPSTKQFTAAVSQFEIAVAQMTAAIGIYTSAVGAALSTVSKTV